MELTIVKAWKCTECDYSTLEIEDDSPLYECGDCGAVLSPEALRVAGGDGAQPWGLRPHKRTEAGMMQTLLIGLQEGKQGENLALALAEVARQIGAGETSGMVHGQPWALKEEGGRLEHESGFNETKTHDDGGTVTHCGFCGMHLQSYNPPPLKV